MANLFPDMAIGNVTSISTRYGYWAHVIIRSKSGNLLTRTQLESVRDLDSYIQSLTVPYDNETDIDYSNMCLQFGSSCYVVGQLFFSAEFLTAVDSGSVPYPEFGTTNYEDNIGGIIQTDSTGTILKGMEYILLEYLFRFDGGENNANFTAWLTNFANKMKDVSSDHFEIAYSHVFSLAEELDKTITGDIILFIATICVMVVYACVASMSARYDGRYMSSPFYCKGSFLDEITD